ncbi:MAG: hypothetical protein J7K62_00895 [Thermoplasmata archaeon]|nr:hypothetical protein [Thermoplasmata archaeon]
MTSMYGRYGLSHREAARLGIRPLEYVEVEDPDFANEARYIPPDLDDLIEGYDLVWTLTIEQSYAEQRRWDEFISLREIIQNALDEEHEVYGYDNIAIRVETDNLGTWVKDRGRGLKYRAFMLGAHEKPCWTRGYFGEGLKVAALWFTSNIGDVYFFTKDVVYRCYYSNLADALVVVFGRSNVFINGTHVLMYDWWPPSKKSIHRIYVETSPYYKVVFRKDYPDEKCRYVMPNTILETPEGEEPALYVRDIFVNYFRNLFGGWRPRALYSYNLWWVELEPNRKNVQSSSDLLAEMSYLIVSSPDLLIDLLEQCIEEGEHGGTRYFELKPKYFEIELPFSDGIDRLTDYEADVLFDKVKEFCDLRGITGWAVESDLEAVIATGHEGGICLLIPFNMRPLFEKVPKAESFVIKSILDSTKGNVIDEKYLGLGKRIFLAVYRFMADKIAETKVVLYDGKRSYYDESKDVIFIAIDEVHEKRKFIHELAHAYGFKTYRSAPDVSENFERALERVAANIWDITMSTAYGRVISRIYAGGLYATRKDPSEFFGFYAEYYGNYQDFMFDPTIFIIPVDEDRRIYGFFHIHRYITGIPVEDYYMEFVGKRIDLIRKIWLRLSREKIVTRDILSELEREFPEIDELEMFPMIDTIVSRFEYIENIYYYDLIKDKYVPIL